MKAITLTQPWASAVALGSKRIETRSWSTSYRGPVAIHAAKGFKVFELLHLNCCWNWIGAMWPTGVRMGNGPTFETTLPFGAIVAVTNIIDCRPTGSFTQAELDEPRQPDDKEFGHLYKWTERQMGDFSLGRFGFVLDRVRALKTPVPCRGMLGLWNVPEPIIEQIAVNLVV